MASMLGVLHIFEIHTANWLERCVGSVCVCVWQDTDESLNESLSWGEGDTFFRSSTPPAERSSSFPASLSFLYYLFPIDLWFHFPSIPGSNHYLPLSVGSFPLPLSWLFVSAEVLFDYAQCLCPCAFQVFIATVLFTVREKHTNGCKLNLSFYESVTGPDLEPTGHLWRKPESASHYITMMATVRA